MSEVLLETIGLGRRFAVGGRVRPGRHAPQLVAVDDVNLRIRPGEAVGLVGESGCGKSTLVRLIARLLDPSDGAVVFRERDIGAVPAARFARHPARGRIQMVFQDPTDSLNPRFTAAETIAEPMRLLAGGATPAAVADLARAVGLPDELLSRYPHQLSGGQKARVGI
ncbi:MAG: ATP-binding cassette domain-containing protein, partial [Burkholderiales bacterium]|nr:ATP-binding cassette domain-containing protein [Burkholderiales bacterium]